MFHQSKAVQEYDGNIWLIFKPVHQESDFCVILNHGEAAKLDSMLHHVLKEYEDGLARQARGVSPAAAGERPPDTG